MVTSKTPWQPSWPYRPRSLHPCSCCCSSCYWTYCWPPSSNFLRRTSQGTSCPLLQSYPLCDLITLLPLLYFATGVLTRARRFLIRWHRGHRNPDQGQAPYLFTELPRRGLLGNPLAGYRKPIHHLSGRSRGWRVCQRSSLTNSLSMPAIVAPSD
jgi:hypothetical protein